MSGRGRATRRRVSIANKSPVRTFRYNQPIGEFQNEGVLPISKKNGPGPKYYSAYGAPPSKEVAEFMREGMYSGPPNKGVEKAIAIANGNIRRRGLDPVEWAEEVAHEARYNNNTLGQSTWEWICSGFGCFRRRKTGGKTRKTHSKKQRKTRRR
jgi:hypothetical protein